MTDLTESIKAVSIEKVNDRTVITYKKSKIVGLATPADVMNSILVAARMQAEKYIEKLAKGETLTEKEVTALSQLASITKTTVIIDTHQQQTPTVQNATDIEVLKSNIFARLADKSS
jgi:hypothetical protein